MLSQHSWDLALTSTLGISASVVLAEVGRLLEPVVFVFLNFVCLELPVCTESFIPPSSLAALLGLLGRCGIL